MFSIYKYPLPLLLLILALLGTVTAARAQEDAETLILDNAQASYPLAPHAFFLEDSGGNLAIAEVSQPEFAARFTPSQVKTLNFGATRSVYWFRIRVRNETSQERDWFLAFPDALPGRIDLYYQPADQTGWMHQQAGRWLPAINRAYLHPHFVFPLELAPAAEATLYLRLQASIMVQLSASLWPAGLFEQTNHLFFLGLGMFYGILLVLAVYNLVIFAFLRKLSYLYFSIFTALLMFNIAAIDGVAYAYLFPNWPHHDLHFFTMAALPVSAIFFIRDFLELKKRLPWMNRILIVLAAVCVFIFPLYWFRNPALDNLTTTALLNLHTLLGILAVVSALIIWRDGLLTARYFLFGWLAFLSNMIIISTSAQGLFPNTPIYYSAYYISIALMVTLLSLALADQINLLRLQAVKAELAMRESEGRFRHLYERAPMGILIGDRAGFIQHANHAMVDLLGYDEEELVNRHFLELIHPKDRTATDQDFQQLTHEKHSVYEGEVRYLHKDGSPIWVWRSVSTLRDDNEQIIQSFALYKDIRERKKQEAELRHYSEHLEEMVADRTSALERSQEQLTTLNRASQTINMAGLVNEQVFIALRAACAWLVPADVVAVSLVDQTDQEVEVVFLMDRDTRLPGRRYPLEGSCVAGVLQSGTTITVNNYQDQPCWPWSPPGVRSGMAVMLRGSTEILGALNVQSYTPNAYSDAHRAALESFAAHVSITLENIRRYKRLERAAVIEERQRLASELHDSVTQLLYSIAMMSGGWGLKASKDQLPNPADHFYQLEELSLQALKEMRVLIHQLRLPVLAEVGLLKALEDRLNKVERRLQIEAILQVEGRFPKLAAVMEEEIYFIILEVLNNSLRHARAAAVQVNIWLENDQLHFVVADNGRGYDPALLSRGMGTSILDARAAAIGAVVQRDSQPGQGTRVEVVVKI